MDFYHISEKIGDGNDENEGDDVDGADIENHDGLGDDKEGDEDDVDEREDEDVGVGGRGSLSLKSLTEARHSLSLATPSRLSMAAEALFSSASSSSSSSSSNSSSSSSPHRPTSAFFSNLIHTTDRNISTGISNVTGSGPGILGREGGKDIQRDECIALSTMLEEVEDLVLAGDIDGFLRRFGSTMMFSELFSGDKDRMESVEANGEETIDESMSDITQPCMPDNIPSSPQNSSFTNLSPENISVDGDMNSNIPLSMTASLPPSRSEKRSHVRSLSVPHPSHSYSSSGHVITSKQGVSLAISLSLATSTSSQWRRKFSVNSSSTSPTNIPPLSSPTSHRGHSKSVDFVNVSEGERNGGDLTAEINSLDQISPTKVAAMGGDDKA